MVLYITPYCFYAVVQDKSPAIEVREVVVERGEQYWVRKATFLTDGLTIAIEYAEELEAFALGQS